MELEIGTLAPGEREAGALVAARALQPNPGSVAAYGGDERRRTRILARLFRALFAARDEQPLCARRDGQVVGVAGFDPLGACRRLAALDLRLLPPLLAIGPRAAVATLRITAAWERLDPDEPHSHLGPVAVDPDRQHEGIGSRLMEAYCVALDARGEPSYLETDKPENVVFYRRFGFEVTHEQEVLGVPMWFMQRAPGR